MRNDNRGLTFVELIIVVAIMSVLVGVAGYGLGLINGKAADECSQKIMFTLDQARTKAVGKYSVTYKLYRNSSTGLVEVEECVIAKAGDEEVKTKSTVGAKNVKVVCYFTSGDPKTIAGTDYLLLKFDRATGGFKPEIDGGADCEKIEVSKAQTTKKIMLVPPTGKVYME
ncbi:MAG: prepilin-type N-terminal cleavage/methylation domain-containing protein [Lachnospiraceae bacterium]|nr:prepilin-type N-terminal cleavage/methylation domain-containing protein [Lachnospiraceae bacterium]